jgi:hypothetical protein
VCGQLNSARALVLPLIFTGLDEQADENCENKLRYFIYQEMKIPERIEFGNIHRFGKKNAERPRPIIARFLYYLDLDKVKKATSSLFTKSLSLISTTFDFFFFSSFIIGYSFRLLSSISGGNCSLTPKWVPLRFLPAFLTLSTVDQPLDRINVRG